ncbi:MAG: O-antigen ligase family protein [Bacteroidota bacterium]|nr:O-antigen ligase family protein [Bacteroidota bacterium]
MDRTIGTVLWYAVLAVSLTLIFSTAAAQAAALIAVMAWVWLAVHGKTAFPPKRIAIPFLAFYLARAVSVLWSVVPAESVHILRTETVFALYFFAVHGAVARDPEKRLPVVVRLLVWTGVLAALIGATKAFAFGQARISSTTSGYYTLGMYLCLSLIAVLALGPSREIVPVRLQYRFLAWVPAPAWWGIACTVLLVGVILTENRLHWALAAAAVFGYSVSRRRLVAPALAIMAIAVSLLFPSVFERVARRTASPSVMSGRDVIWGAAWSMAGERPLTGFGPRSFRAVFPAFDRLEDKGVSSWHNDFIQVYMDSGAPALLAFLAMVAAGLWLSATSRTRHPRGDPLSPYPAAVLGMLAAFALASGVLDVILSLAYFTALAIAATLAVRSSTRHEPASSAGGRP